MLIAKMYPLDIKIEYSFFKKLTLYFFRGGGGKWRSFPWNSNEFKKAQQKSNS